MPNDEEDPMITAKKKGFLQRYNPAPSKAIALQRAIGAALQRNSTYIGNVDAALRLNFRNKWKSMLENYSKDQRLFSKDHSLFEDVTSTFPVVVQFRDEMRRHLTQRGMPQADFRISHAQKSISVFLKHLWCMNACQMPAVCPVDNRIMTAAGAPNRLRPWGKVDDICCHEKQVCHERQVCHARQLKYLWNFARESGHSLAEWELLKFPETSSTAC